MGRSVTSQRGLLRVDDFLARDERFIGSMPQKL